jgi:hypothetical protein
MRRPSLRLVGRLVLAGTCALLFRECTYADFVRVRVGLRPASPLPQDDRVTVRLPDLTALAPASAVLIVDVRNDAATERTIVLSLETGVVGRLQVPAGRQRRLAASVPAAARRGDDRTLTLAGNGEGWRLARAQMGNVRGFNEGVFNVVVVPAASDVARLPWWYVLAVGGLVLAAARWRAPRSRLGVAAYGAAALLSTTTLMTAWTSPYVSPYRLLLAPHTALVLLALLFAPAVRALLQPALRSAHDSIRRAYQSLRAHTQRGVGVMPLQTSDAAIVYTVLLAVLAATSRPRLAGDGPEYLAMARDFARFEWPAAEVTHFWLYSLLAAPFVAVTERLYFGAPLGFLILNVILLVTAFIAVGARLGLAPLALLFLGPVVWWMDKVAAEVFMFAALAVASATLRSRPGWALVSLGVAAAHNPAAALLLAGAGVMILTKGWARLAEPRFALAAACAVGLAVLHPIYFTVRLGRATPLLDADAVRWPSAGEWRAVLSDANIGLIANAPLFVLAVTIAATAFRHRWRTAAESAWALMAAVVLLFAFAQTNNFNHGGTRDMSRYGLWLMPLAIPWLAQHASTASARSKRGLGIVAVASVIWCALAFHPGAPERFLRPTLLADALWTKWPAASNPLPEIFVERLAGREASILPIATADCEKVLLKGQGNVSTMWPARCGAPATPELCVRRDALCYANRSGGGYAFEEIRPRFPAAFSLHAENSAAR